MVEARRQHADDGVVVVVDAHGAADRGAVAPEAALPESVADEADGRDARRFVGWRERSTDERLDAEHGKEAARHAPHLDALRLVDAGDVARHRLVAGDIGERSGVRAKIEELGERHRHLAVAEVRRDRDEPRRGVVPEWLEQDAVDDAEHRRVDGDAERQRQHGHDGEARAADQPADRDSGLVQTCAHLDLDDLQGARTRDDTIDSLYSMAV
jgi:hypothetical protein